MDYLIDYLNHSVLYSTLKERLEFKRKSRLIRFIFLDLVIGWYILYNNYVNISEINTIFWDYVDLLATYLLKLMDWLVNNPAGLKLNEPVNSTLAGFFNYHIYLWATFSSFLRFEKFTQYMMYTMLAGFSVFAAAISDFANVLCVHFFCFDAYAYKLWKVTYYTITELWGLVRGKKWNPLRDRRDNISLDTRQQFLSTSLFVILLFLLPTIIVYFLVFRTIRICATSLIWILRFVANWPIFVAKLLNGSKMD